MVKKLFKYEIASFARVLWPLYLITIAVAFFGRIIQFFESESILYTIIFVLVTFALFTTIMICFIGTLAIGVIRFYKNLFSSEGYLTFTLPFTTAQHIWVKLLSAALFQLIALITAVISVVIMLSGDVLVEVIKAIDYLGGVVFDIAGANLIFYIIEIILLIFATFFYEYLIYYTCIAIGQTARKNRILLAVGVYIIYYFIIQLASMFLSMIGSFAAALGAFDKIFLFVENNPFAVIHIFLCAMIVLLTGLSVACFAIIHSTIKKKLNLE